MISSSEKPPASPWPWIAEWIDACVITGTHACTAPGGDAPTAAHAVSPRYEPPKTPTRPSHHGCCRTHATVAAPSSRSCSIGTNIPSEPKRPRVSWRSTA